MTKTYTQEQVDAMVANASRQMRDAAVNACDEINRHPLHQSKEAYGCAYALKHIIAALPIPGEEK